MADSDYGTPFDNKKKKEMIQQRCVMIKNISGQDNVAIGICGAYTCAKTNKDGMFSSPSVSSASKADNLLNQLAAENKKLTQEKIKLNLKVLELQKENYSLTQDNLKYKLKAEEEKGKVWKDLNKNINSIYQKIVDWFNS
jgi:hypothetical protein